MAKRKYVVRVARYDHPEFNDCPFLECLRYAGHVATHNETEKVFDILPPRNKDIDTQIWAEHLAGKMQSFGYNAVAAPEWGDMSAFDKAFI